MLEFHSHQILCSVAAAYVHSHRGKIFKRFAIRTYGFIKIKIFDKILWVWGLNTVGKTYKGEGEADSQS